MNEHGAETAEITTLETPVAPVRDRPRLRGTPGEQALRRILDASLGNEALDLLEVRTPGGGE